jgi:serine phosphatase RsbU (regulator of sigma subunit)
VSSASQAKLEAAKQLSIRTPDGTTKMVPLTGERLGLGRAASNQLHYPESPGLSRQHLEFELRGNDWYVRDLGSRNGTFVNKRRLAGEHRLANGDRIGAGELLIEFGDARAVKTETVSFIEQALAPQHAATHTTDLAGALSEGTRLAARDTRAIEALIRAGQELSGHRSLAELFRLILDLSMNAVSADRGVLMTLENGELISQTTTGGTFQISTTVRNRVMTERRSVLVVDAQSDADFNARESIVRQRVRSIMAVPLQTGEKVIGLIYVDVVNILRAFAKEDLSLLTVMANIAAIRIEQARLMEVEQAERVHARELEQAAEIQQQLLPSAPPLVRGFEALGLNLPCRTVGGDYFDYFRYTDGRVALLVGDVAGKGMPAAMLMSSLQARLQVLAESTLEPADLVAKLNRGLLSKCPGNRFITFFYSLFNSETGELVYCNAGHNPPMILRSGGKVERLEIGGPILGLFSALPYSEGRARLDPGDVLVLYSDGVTEACPPDSNDEFGEDRLAEIVQDLGCEPVDAVLEAIVRELRGWVRGASFADDVTLLVARRATAS